MNTIDRWQYEHVECIEQLCPKEDIELQRCHFSYLYTITQRDDSKLVLPYSVNLLINICRAGIPGPGLATTFLTIPTWAIYDCKQRTVHA